MTLFGIGFLSPWLLLALLALPILWILLRAVPPAPIRRMFPGVILLLGLKDEEQVSDRTPWWLLLLRMLAVAALIIGLAGPTLSPRESDLNASDKLLVVLDGSWALAQDWNAQTRAIDAALRDAASRGQTAAFLNLADPEVPVFVAADTARAALLGVGPRPWDQTSDAQEFIPEGDFDTLWVSDGLARETRGALLTVLQERGDVRVLQSQRPVMGLKPAYFEDGALRLDVVRSGGPALSADVVAMGRDPAGRMTVLARGEAEFADTETEASVLLSLPSELRGRITRFEIEGLRSAGAVSLADDSLKRREIVLRAGRDSDEGLQLLSPLHYLETALETNADFLDGPLLEVLPANPDVVILADVARVTGDEEEALLAWLENGGLLLRFAGPRIAASDLSRESEDPLMPVRLRAGGRTVGGAMSWGEPKALAPFSQGSPFAGLDVSAEVTVTAQVLAQPDPTLADRVIAQLADGTPLVTRKRVGAGQVILFHVTANAEWSSLPLSGLFVQMLERLSVSSSSQGVSAEAFEGTFWKAERVLDAFGALEDAGNQPGVDGPDLVSAPLSPDLLPGLYVSDDLYFARNVVLPETELVPFDWPADVEVLGLSIEQDFPLAGLLLALAAGLLVVDVAASLWLSGRLTPMGQAAALALALILSAAAVPSPVHAQDEAAILATSEVVFGHVLTGNAELDRIAEAGLRGLSETLFQRTSVEPSAPRGVDLEQDELAFYPFLYWPIDPNQPIPSDQAYAKLNAYLRTGGMILFDTRDGDVAQFGSGTPAGRRLQQLAVSLDVPALEPIPNDHVLTRAFYLLQDFPGRYLGGPVWVEAAPADAVQIEGMPFRNLNDGVTPVIVGGNDWASAWAIDQRGAPMFQVGRGYAGERQREFANRFGVNLIMHVLTGNYKSDQVHVPTLLERLGQ